MGASDTFKSVNNCLVSNQMSRFKSDMSDRCAKCLLEWSLGIYMAEWPFKSSPVRAILKLTLKNKLRKILRLPKK